MVKIRLEKPEDITFIHYVNEQAFGRLSEAKLVDKLRLASANHLSLVADDNGFIVGHIMFTPVIVTDGKHKKTGMGLAPMAVQPSRQRKGIGSLLVENGLNILHEKGCPFVVVLGHTDYYPRFGFQPASGFNIKCQWEGVPDEAFMILVLGKEKMLNISGVVHFSDEFNEAM